MLGLEIGADDYLCKPFSMRELMARIKVLLRRAALVDGAGRQPEDRATVAGDLTLDPLRLSAAWKGTPVPLTVTEFLLLSALARRPGVVKTRDQLMEEAYPDRVSVSDRTIDSHVKRIRRKFEARRSRRSRRSKACTAPATASSRTSDGAAPRLDRSPGRSRIVVRLLAFNLLLVFLPGRGNPLPRRVREPAARGAGARDGAAGAPAGGRAGRAATQSIRLAPASC